MKVKLASCGIAMTLISNFPYSDNKAPRLKRTINVEKRTNIGGPFIGYISYWQEIVSIALQQFCHEVHKRILDPVLQISLNNKQGI